MPVHPPLQGLEPDRRRRFVGVATVLLVFLAPRSACAYIDPGTFSSLFGSLWPLLGLVVAGLGVLLWPVRWLVRRLWDWACGRPALVKVGRGILRVLRPVGRATWRGLWPLRKSARAIGGAARACPRRAFLAGAGAAVAGAAGGWYWLHTRGRRSGGGHPRVILLGVDGLDPRILETMLARGELVNFRRLREQGGLARLATSNPAHSPNAWTCIATGCDAGEHGVFDFILRDPETYRLDLAVLRRNPSNPLGRREGMFLPVRRCPAFWEVLSEAGVPATVLRWPVTFPPDAVTGRALSGLGVPDIKGGLGSYTFYTTRAAAAGEEGGGKVAVVQPSGNVVETVIEGPSIAGLTGAKRATVPLRVVLGPDGRRVRLVVEGESRELEVGQWSGYVHLRFKAGLAGSVAGLAAFYLKAVEPHLELYLSPVEVDPLEPAFPISSPGSYARELAEAIGSYHTLGMPEDTHAVTEGRLDLDAFLHLCHQINAERERMLVHELSRFDDGLLALVADTSDRLQHMFWVTRDPGHPLYDAALARRYGHVIPDVYRYADRLLGHVLAASGDKTAVLVVSDHGFAPFRRAVHLNRWLVENGLMLLDEAPADAEGGALFRHVVWEETSAYALGFGGIYVNIQGREGRGAIAPGADYRTVCEQVASRLTVLRDPQSGQRPVRRVYFRDELYHGPHAGAGPDLVVGLAPGYRVSWQTALGGAPEGLLEDNRKLWSGDHIVDPSFVPGVLLASQPLKGAHLRQADVAPTVLNAFAVPKSEAMRGDAFL